MCVNLYPFERTVARGDASDAEIIENIDIGGPTMIRAAAKNHAFAAVVVDPEGYDAVLAELREADSRLSLPTRERLAAERLRYTARYDAAISPWFAERSDEDFPALHGARLQKVLDLRYGENPHQRAAYYAEVGAPRHLLSGRASATARSSRSTTCSTSTRRASSSRSSTSPACAIVKHNNPCGAALGRRRGLEAYRGPSPATRRAPTAA